MYWTTRCRLSECWSEAEIDSQLPFTAFNLTRPNPRADIYLDSDDVYSYLPCRVLENWFLLAKPKPLHYFTRDDLSSFPNRRVSLPVDSQEMQDYILVGTLKPQHPQQEPIKMELDDMDFYTIDGTRGYRGFWVATSKARYWLGNPCSKTATIPQLKIRVGGVALYRDDEEVGATTGITVVLPSQKHLHQFHRAQLGLLSNLIDIFLPSEERYSCSLHDHTLKEIDELLTPATQELFEFYKSESKSCNMPILFKHAFDLDLLKSSKFLLPHIRTIHPDIEKSRWYLELFEHELGENGPASSRNGAMLHSKVSEDYWAMSATIAENRSHQLPTGQSDPMAPQKEVNLLFPIELESKFRVSRSKLSDDSRPSCSRNKENGIESTSPMVIDAWTSSLDEHLRIIEPPQDTRGEPMWSQSPASMSQVVEVLSVPQTCLSARTVTSASPLRFQQAPIQSLERQPSSELHSTESVTFAGMVIPRKKQKLGEDILCVPLIFQLAAQN